MNKPSNYTSKPWDSVIGKWEAERIAQNIMVILARTGNESSKIGAKPVENCGGR